MGFWTRLINLFSFIEFMELIKIDKTSGIPLLGALPFGIIDRGTNILQVRCTSVCNMQCAFCSTSANNFKMHPVNYIVDVDYLLEWVKKVAEFKGDNLQIFLDSVGDPLTHPDFVKLVVGLRKIKQIRDIIVITNGTLLTKDKIDALENAGLTRINISLHSLDREQSKKLFGNRAYDLDKVLEIIKYISKSKIKLMLTPVLLHGVNDDEIEKIIKLAKEIGCLVGIQNYETYKYSRKMKEAEKITYWKFYKKIEELEKKYDMGLRFQNEQFNIEKRERLAVDFKVGEKVNAEIVAPGWFSNQMIGKAKNRCISINNCNHGLGNSVKVKIIENNNNIYIAEKINKN